MIAFVYFAGAVALAYWVGRHGAGYGIAVFLVSVAVWQFTVDGPASFLEPIGCVNYGPRAMDC